MTQIRMGIVRRGDGTDVLVKGTIHVSPYSRTVTNTVPSDVGTGDDKSPHPASSPLAISITKP